MLPLVSVFLPTYNSERFIRGAIESLIAQSYKNLEIVISDDASTDKTCEIIQAYQEKHPLIIRFYSQKNNLGITGNCNYLLEKCRGEYISFFSGDDIYSAPEKIQKQVSFLEENSGYSLCGTYTQLIDESGRALKVAFDWKRKSNPIYTYKDILESSNNLIPTVSYMARRNSLPGEGYDNRLRVASDSLFFFRIACTGKIYIIPEVLTSYRVYLSESQKTGYFDDTLVSIALAEFYKPDCALAAKNARALAYFSFALNQYRRGNRKAKVFELIRSSLINKFKVKTLVLFALVIVSIKA